MILYLIWLFDDFIYSKLKQAFINYIQFSAKMSRSYFKNELYYMAYQKETQTKKQQKIKKQNELKQKFAKTKKGQSIAAIQQQREMKKQQKQRKIQQMHNKIHVDDTFAIKKQLDTNKKSEEDQLEQQFLKSFKKKDQSKDKTNRFSINFKPSSKLVIKSETPVQKSQQEQRKLKLNNNISFKKLQNNLRQALSLSQNKQKIETQAEEKLQKNQKLQKTGEKQQGSEQQQQGQKGQNIQKTDGQNKTSKKKTKKIKKQANYVRLDLKRKYTERYTGKMNEYRKKYNKNGRMKQKYRIQSQINVEDGQFYNNYISSLSSALCMTINLDNDDSDQSYEQIQAYQFDSSIQWDKKSLNEYLMKYFGFQNFRQGQYETIINILNKKSTLFISETASGKSLTYIMSSMILGGLSIVISPLVSLILDQLSHLPKGFPAACISSLINREQRGKIIKMVHQGKINLLFITPQSLQTDFIYHLQDFPRINFVCIDQAHSLSELSHNFRTSFLALGDIVLNLINYTSVKPTILGLTATANIETVQSIKQKLNIQQQVRSNRTMNKNIYITISRQRGAEKYQSLIKYLNVPIINKCKGILIYTRTKYIMDQVYNYITNSSGFSVAIYHSALTNKQKTQTLRQFRQGTKKIVVATIALGMGLDFQHLECVIHINMPKSIQNYVQQVGRAGRRQKRAYCHLFLDDNDYITQRNYIVADELEKPMLKTLYTCLKKYSDQSSDKGHYKSVKKLNKQMKTIKRTTPTQLIDQNDEDYLKKIYEKDEFKGQNMMMRQLQNANTLQQIQKLQKQEEQRQRIIKVATLMLQLNKNDDENMIINQENQEEEDQDQIYHDENQEQLQKAENQQNIQNIGKPQKRVSKNSQSVNTKLFYARVQTLKQLTQFREQVILTLLIKIQSLLKDDQDIKFKVLPLSFEQIKIGFFKNNQAQVKQQSQFFRNLVEQCKTVKGTTYVPLVKKCNTLGMKPMTLLANLYRLSNQYTIKIELETPIFLWQFQGKKNQDQYNEQDRLFNGLVQRGFQKLLSEQYLDKVTYEINNVQKTSITKLNTLYSLVFNHSNENMIHIIKKNIIIPYEQQIGKNCVTRQFDHYFKSNLQQFYYKITHNNDDQAEQLVIPTQSILKQDETQIMGCINLFFKQEIANIFEPRNKDEYIHTLRQLIEKYQNGKIITRILMGVNSGEVSWKIYGNRSYWMLFKLKNYAQLLQTVQKLIQQYKSQANSGDI